MISIVCSMNSNLMFCGSVTLLDFLTQINVWAENISYFDNLMFYQLQLVTWNVYLGPGIRLFWNLGSIKTRTNDKSIEW